MLDEGTIRVIIGADIVPTSSSEEAFRNASMDEPLGTELYEKLLSADIRIINLEVPLTELRIPGRANRIYPVLPREVSRSRTISLLRSRTNSSRWKIWSP